MAQRINLSDYSAHPQARSIPPTMNHPQPYQSFTFHLPCRPDPNEIVRKLKIILGCGIDISYLLPLFHEPVLGAFIHLALQVRGGFDPADLVQAASTLVATTSDFSQFISSELSSRGVSMISSDCGLSRLSGTTFGGPDTPTSFKRLDIGQNISLTSGYAFPSFGSTLHDHHLQHQHQEQQGYTYSNIHNPGLVFYNSLDVEDEAFLYNDSAHDNGDNGLPSTTPRSMSYAEHLQANQEMQPRSSSGTFGITESESMQPESTVVQPEQYIHDTIPTSLTPAYSNPLSPFEEDLTPASSHKTPQSSNAGLPHYSESIRRPSRVNLPTRTSKPSLAATKDAEFQPYDPDVLRRPTNKKDRSPCPHCDVTFESLPEFIFHIEAKHEQPRTYECQHLDMKMKICAYSTTRKSTMTRHHSDHHSENKCNMSELCCKEIAKPHPKRNWGCGWCLHHSENIKAWAEHHMTTHQNCCRGQFNFTLLVKSLLLQQATASWWKQEVQNLRDSTGYEYDITWSSNNVEVKRLVTALETGRYQDENLDKIGSLQQYLVMQFMDQAVKVRSHPITPSNKRAATSSPQGSKGVGSRPRRDLHHQTSRSALNRTLPGYDNAILADVEKGIAIFKRPVQRQDSNFV